MDMNARFGLQCTPFTREISVDHLFPHLVNDIYSCSPATTILARGVVGTAPPSCHGKRYSNACISCAGCSRALPNVRAGLTSGVRDARWRSAGRAARRGTRIAQGRE